MTAIKIITVITFDDEIAKKPNADEERERLKEAAIEVTGSDKKNGVFMIANSVRGQEYDSVYKKRVLEMLEQAAKCGERSIRMRQTTRESPKKQTRHSDSDAGVKCPVENTEEPDYPGKKWWSLPSDFPHWMKSWKLACVTDGNLILMNKHGRYISFVTLMKASENWKTRGRRCFGKKTE